MYVNTTTGNSSSTCDTITHIIICTRKTCRILARAFSEICEIPNLCRVRIIYKWTLYLVYLHIFYIYIYSNTIHPTSFLLGHGGRVEKRDTQTVPGFLCRYILSIDYHLTSWANLRVSPSSDTPLTLLTQTKRKESFTALSLLLHYIYRLPIYNILLLYSHTWVFSFSMW